MKIEKLVGISRDRPKANNHLSQGFKFGEHFQVDFPLSTKNLISLSSEIIKSYMQVFTVLQWNRNITKCHWTGKMCLL